MYFNMSVLSMIHTLVLPTAAMESNSTILPDEVYEYFMDNLNTTNGTYGNGAHGNSTNGNATFDNDTFDCTNEYCVSDEDYLRMIEDYVYPSSLYEWILISLHITVFIVGIIGNALVCVSVYHNRTMRTVTNYYIVNLAVADFLVILICLPPSVLWDVTKTWFFGSITCKLVLYLQNVSVSVSVLTLSFISVDRWNAICNPLDFKSTAGKAKFYIMLIWILALLIALPEGIVLETQRHTLPIETLYLTDCTHTWSHTSTKVYQLFLILVLYVAPLILMAFTYYQITRVLWNKNIPGANESNQVPLRICGKVGDRAGPLRSNTSCEGQVRSRRKASKMLMAVVIMFSLCYFPVHLINALRYTVGLPQTTETTVASLISHWLCYANSAINPIIYNIMNGKFRKEFKNLFTCQCLRKEKRQSRPATTYLCKYTSTVTHCDRKVQALATICEKKESGTVGDINDEEKETDDEIDCSESCDEENFDDNDTV